METTARRASCGATATTVAAAAAAVKGGLGPKGHPTNGDTDDLYVVGKILAEKTENGTTYFKVRWKNYPPSNDTWEPEHNLTVVADMIEAFRSSRANKLGTGQQQHHHHHHRASTGSGSGGGGSNSRKRPAQKKWDQSPAPTAAAAKAKLLDELDDERPKCRRRLNGGSAGVGSGGGGGGGSRDSEDASEDTTGEEGNSNNSEGGSSFANSIGSSGVTEPAPGANSTVSAPPFRSSASASTIAVVATVVKDAPAAPGSSDSGCQLTGASGVTSPASSTLAPPPPPPPTSTTTSSSGQGKPAQAQHYQSPLLADLLGSAKRESAPGPGDAPGSAADDRPPAAAASSSSSSALAPTSSSSPTTPASSSAGPAEDADCRYVANQAELLRAHASGQRARLPPNRPPPLSWPLLCRAVERGDWPAVCRTIGSLLSSAEAAATSPGAAAQQPLTAADLQQLLCLAVARGHACIVDLLLDSAATAGPAIVDVDCRSAESGLTLLMLAVERDSPALAHRLLLAGADPNLTCPAGNCALQRAIRHRRPHLVDILCCLGGVDFGAETCEGQTPLRYARRLCPQSAAVLQLYVGHLCRSMHDHLADHLGRLGFAPAALLFAPRYLRPRPGRDCKLRFRLPAEEAARQGHAVALLHCRQRPFSALLRRQPCPEPVALHCWLADGPCCVDSVRLNGTAQRSLTACGAAFLVALASPTPGENCLQLAFSGGSSNSSGSSAALDCGLRIGVFAFRLASLPLSADAMDK